MAITWIFYDVLHILEEDSLLDISNVLHLSCVHYVYIYSLQAALAVFTSGWNNHPLKWWIIVFYCYGCCNRGSLLSMKTSWSCLSLNVFVRRVTCSDIAVCFAVQECWTPFYAHIWGFMMSSVSVYPSCKLSWHVSRCIIVMAEPPYHNRVLTYLFQDVEKPHTWTTVAYGTAQPPIWRRKDCGMTTFKTPLLSFVPW